jgi:3-isopropylmalate dehydrogenase
MVFVRENSEGLYVGAGGFARRGTAEEVATQESVNTRRGVDRCLRYAFDLARETGRRGHVTLAHKTNVLAYAGDLWARAFADMAASYPDVSTDYVHVDAACVYLVEDPGRFDVVVTDNMFGDILTDLGAALQGGMGVAAGANLNPEGVSMFEPIGGTAPDHVGRGTINPLAAIGALELMLRTLGEREAADRVESGISFAVSKMHSMRAGEMGFSTSEVGDLVVEGATR